MNSLFFLRQYGTGAAEGRSSFVGQEWRLADLRCAATRTCSRWASSGKAGTCRLPRLLQRPQQLAVERVGAGNDSSGLEHVLAAVEIGDEASGLAHQCDSRRHVPGREAALPVGVEPAG